MRKTNYHTHTARCFHASGSDEAYVESALKNGYQVLGFSDHSPWKYDSDYVATMRMTPAELPGYLDSIRSLREKYAGRIQILAGLECEYYPRYQDWLRRMVSENGLDYVIFGNHFYRSDEDGPYFGRATKDRAMLRRYVDSSVEGMESGLYAYFAHPDLFMRCYPGFDADARAASRELCRAAKRLGVPLEYNLMGALYNDNYGVDGYPHEGFWRIAAAEGCTAVIGVDAHAPEQLETDRYRDQGLRLLRGLGMEILDEIPLRTDLRKTEEKGPQRDARRR